jgi:hypothetical protein
MLELGWMPLSPDGIAMGHSCGVENTSEGEGIHGTVRIIGADLAKNVFQLHGVAVDGSVVFRKKLSRPQFARLVVSRVWTDWDSNHFG